MLLKDETEILDEGIRKAIIEEIVQGENVKRRNQFLKRQEIYKDKTKKWVMKQLEQEGLRQSTLALMRNRASNISVCRKIVNKLARCYVGGVERNSDDNQLNEKITLASRLLDADTRFKKIDRYRELHRNSLMQVIPVKDLEESMDDMERFKISLRPLAPFQYDVVESFENREKPMVVILSDFFEASMSEVAIANEKDDLIADSRLDQNKGLSKRNFIWWSDGLHFTTDSKGQIINNLSPDDLINPIERLPFVNVSEDQDGSFWAEGGDDLIDGSILINQMLTDMFSIAYRQGWGQLVLSGKNVPRIESDGPHTAIILEQNDGDPAPTAQYLSANPPLDSWMNMVEQTVALVLSTNNLSPTNIANKLDASQFPSGISLLIEQSEATDNIEDKQKLFKDVERQVWKIFAKWQNLLLDKKVLNSSFSEIGNLQEDMDLSIKFSKTKPVITEEQKLANLEKRKELGLDSMIDLIRKDNPDLTEQEAEEKLLRIQGERARRLANSITEEVNG